MPHQVRRYYYLTFASIRPIETKTIIILAMVVGSNIAIAQTAVSVSVDRALTTLPEMM